MIGQCPENTTCPITLESLEGQDVFVHGTTGFVMRDLYLYLCRSLYFTNPVNRVPFDLAALEALETRMRQVHGDDVIEISPGPTASSAETDAWSFTDDGMRAMSDSEILERLTVCVTRNDDDLVEIEVDLDLAGVLGPLGDDDAAETPATSSVHVCNDNNDDPPYPSVVRLFLDAGRARRLKEEMDLVQFLEYESAAIFRCLCDVVCESEWQRWAWEKTSAIVLEHVADHVNDDEIRSIIHNLGEDVITDSDDLHLDVHYTSSWDVYRLALMTMWEHRLALSIRDMAAIDANEAEVLVRMHRAAIPGDMAPEDQEYLRGVLEGLATGRQERD